MGREIRRVPPGWEHPRYTADDVTRTQQALIGRYRPMFDRSAEDAIREWIDQAEAWQKGEAEHQHEDDGRTLVEYTEWNGPSPDPEMCRPAFNSKPTHYQIYETVSEGTPTSPAFQTEAEMVDWLLTVGDDFSGRVDQATAEAFVRSGSVPSMVMVGGKLIPGIKAAGI